MIVGPKYDDPFIAGSFGHWPLLYCCAAIWMRSLFVVQQARMIDGSSCLPTRTRLYGVVVEPFAGIDIVTEDRGPEWRRLGW